MYVGALVRRNVQETCMQHRGNAKAELLGAKLRNWSEA